MTRTPEHVVSERLGLVRRALRKSKWMVPLTAVALGLWALAIAKMLPPVYEASTTIRILRNPSLADGGSRQQTGPEDQETLRAEAMWFTSRRILEPVVERLGLEQTAPTSLFASVVSRLKSKVKGLLGRPDGEGPGSNDVVEKLQDGALKVKQIRGSEVLEIRVNWDDPHLARDIANTAVDVFIERYQEFNQARAENTRDYLEKQVALVKLDLDKSERQLVEFQERTGLISPPGTVPGTSGQELLDALAIEKGQTKLSRALAVADREAMDPNAADKEQQAQRNVLDARIRAYDDRLSELSAQITEAEKRNLQLRKYQQEYQVLAREQRVLEELYMMLDRSLAAAVVDQGTNLYDVRVFDPALAPLKPLKPKPFLMAAKGVFGGAVLGLVLAFSAAYRAQRRMEKCNDADD